MRRNLPKWIVPAAATALWVACAFSSRAITVAELQKQMAGGAHPNIIDVRSQLLFSRGHIPGAINVPASLCAAKKLPPLGSVIVYDEGLGRRNVDRAAAALASKPGISVDVLTGGFAAWETADGLTTRGSGLKPSIPNYITYDQLKAANGDEITLVDLRKPRTAEALAQKDTGNPDDQPLTDLSKEFPGMKQSHSTFASAEPPSKVKTGSGTPSLLVLIDNGDGTAEAEAKKLKASGYKRYAILLGGETMIMRKGKPGLGRTTLTSLRTQTASVTNNPTK